MGETDDRTVAYELPSKDLYQIEHKSSGQYCARLDRQAPA